MVPFAHASDGGGSIRIPASCCGLVGLKPSQGRITLGPFRDESNLGVELCVSRTVRDTAALLDAVHGPGVGDTVIAPPPLRPYVAELGADPGRLRIGVLDEHPLGDPLHDDCRDAVRSAAALLESLGHHVEHGFPAALANRDFGRRFSALWSTNMGVAVQRIESQLGRATNDDDIEAVNRAQVEFAQQRQRCRLRAGSRRQRRVSSSSATVVGQRMGSVAHPDARRAADIDRNVRQRS